MEIVGNVPYYIFAQVSATDGEEIYTDNPSYPFLTLVFTDLNEDYYEG